MILYTTTSIICYLLAWFICNFEPIQDMLDELLLEPKHKILDLLSSVLGCQKCLAFWITLIVTLNPVLAILNSMIAQLHTKIK